MRRLLMMLVLVGASTLIGQEQSDSQQFIFTGQAWAEGWTEEMRTGYVVGYLDGFDFAATMTDLVLEDVHPTAKAQNKAVGKAVRIPLQCLTKMTMGQMVAIIDKFVKDHPERWNKRIGSLADSALAEACTKQ